MKKWLILILFLNCSVAFALTPNEKKIVRHAQGALAEAQKSFKNQREQNAEAERRAENAEKEAEQAKNNAAQTAQNLSTLQGEIQKQAEREAKLVERVNKLQAMEKQVHSYWGIGGILLGFSILVKHIFILIFIIGGLLAAIYILSFFFPAIGIGLIAVKNFIVFLWNRIKGIFGGYKKIETPIQKRKKKIKRKNE